MPTVFQRVSFCFVSTLGTMSPHVATFDLSFCRHILLTNSLAEMHLFDRAREVLSLEGPPENAESVENDRQDVGHLNILAQCWLMLGDRHRALTILRLSNKLVPSHTNSASWLLMSMVGSRPISYIVAGGIAVAALGLAIALVAHFKWPLPR